MRDTHYPGSLSLFKVDSTNEAFIEKVFRSKVNGNRTRYLEIFAESAILDEYPPAVIYLAIYVFTSRNGLEYLRALRVEPQGGFTLALNVED